MKQIIGFLLLLPTGLAAQEIQTLSLDDAFAIGMTSNRSLLIATTNVAKSHANADEVSSHLYPRLFLSGGYSRLKEGSFRFSTTNLAQPLNAGDVVVDNWALRVGLSQPLFTGFRLSGSAEAADLQAEASIHDREAASHEVRIRISTAYWTLYQARQLHQFSVQNVLRLSSYYADTERLVDAGLATENDRLKVEVRLSNARIGQIEARNNARLAEIFLNKVLGMPITTSIRLSSPPVPSSISREEAGTSVDSLVVFARNTRPDLLAAKTRSLATDAGIRAAKGAWWPQIELTANYHYLNPNQRYQPVTPEFLGNWDVGLSLVMDIWNWGATGGRVQQAEALHRQSELYHQQLQEDIAAEVHSALLNIGRSDERLALARLVVSQARENLRVTGDTYRAGAATSTDLLDAEVEMLDAQTQLSGAQVEFALAAMELKRSLGKLESGYSYDE